MRVRVHPYPPAALLGGAIDAWLLKITIQERLGCPVRLVSTNITNYWMDLASGESHIYPELWKSEPFEANLYEKYVLEQQTVVSCGSLGVFGRNGWYTLESDVEQWPALAGWRGLRDPDVRQHFNGTIFAFSPEWGYEEALMKNLKLNYHVHYMGDNGIDLLKSRLIAGKPTLFYMWSPHPFVKQFNLARIQPTPVILS